MNFEISIFFLYSAETPKTKIFILFWKKNIYFKDKGSLTEIN